MLKRFAFLSFLFMLGQLQFSCQNSETYWQPLSMQFPALQTNDADFSLPNLMQEPVQVLFFNVFAPDCTYCIKEMPALKTFYQKHKNNTKIKFVGIGSLLDAIGGAEDITYTQIRPAVQKFVQEEKIDFPVYLAAGKDFAPMSVTGFPETFVLIKDAKGKISLKRKFISVVEVEDLESYLPASE